MHSFKNLTENVPQIRTLFDTEKKTEKKSVNFSLFFCCNPNVHPSCQRRLFSGNLPAMIFFRPHLSGEELYAKLVFVVQSTLPARYVSPLVIVKVE